jgi:hypothetical protein
MYLLFIQATYKQHILKMEGIKPHTKQAKADRIMILIQKAYSTEKLPFALSKSLFLFSSSFKLKNKPLFK